MREASTLRSGSRDSCCGHDGFNLLGPAGQPRTQQAITVRSDQDVVFDANTDIFLGDVEAGLDSDNHTWLKRPVGLSRIVHLKTNMMAESVNEVAAERAALAVAAVGIHVVVRDLKKAVAAAAEVHAR